MRIDRIPDGLILLIVAREELSSSTSDPLWSETTPDRVHWRRAVVASAQHRTEGSIEWDVTSLVPNTGHYSHVRRLAHRPEVMPWP